MLNTPKNYAYIDGNNLHLSIINLGWKLDYRRLRSYLIEKYRVEIAYYFIGYIKENESLYLNLKRHGYKLIYKEVSRDDRDNIKGNVDAELVLQTIIDIEIYNKAIIVSGDGDFACLIKHLVTRDKLARVLAPSRTKCSRLLRKAAGSKIDFLDDLEEKLRYKNEEKPFKDGL